MMFIVAYCCLENMTFYDHPSEKHCAFFMRCVLTRYVVRVKSFLALSVRRRLYCPLSTAMISQQRSMHGTEVKMKMKMDGLKIKVRVLKRVRPGLKLNLV